MRASGSTPRSSRASSVRRDRVERAGPVAAQQVGGDRAAGTPARRTGSAASAFSAHARVASPSPSARRSSPSVSVLSTRRSCRCWASAPSSGTRSRSREGVAAPQRDDPLEVGGLLDGVAGRARRRRRPQVVVELPHVDAQPLRRHEPHVVGVGADVVALLAALALGLQPAPQVGQGDAEVAGRVGRREVRPQQVHRPLPPERRVDRQHGEQLADAGPALLGPHDDLAVGEHAHRPEHLDARRLARRERDHAEQPLGGRRQSPDRRAGPRRSSSWATCPSRSTSHWARARPPSWPARVGAHGELDRPRQRQGGEHGRRRRASACATVSVPSRAASSVAGDVALQLRGPGPSGRSSQQARASGEQT